MEWIWLAAGLVFGLLLGWWWVRRELGPRLALADGMVASLTEECVRLEDELQASTERGDRLVVELADATVVVARTQADLEVVTTELETSRHSLSESERAAKAAAHAGEKIEADRAALAERVRVAEQSAAEAHARYDQVTEEFVSLRRQARQAEQERDEALGDREGTVARLQSSVAESEERMMTLSGEVEERVTALTAERDRLEHSLSIALARVEALKGAAESASEAQEELFRLRTALADGRRRVAALERDLESAEARLAKAETNHAGVPSGEASPAMSASDQPDGSHAVSEEASEEPVRAEVPESPVRVADEPLPDQPVGGDAVEGEGFAGTDESSDVVSGESTAPGKEASEEPERAEVLESPVPVTDEVLLEGSAPDAAPTVDAEAEEQEVDDLRSIKGIGPKFERLLHAREVFTYRQIAELENDAEWETYLDTFSGRIEREGWRSQAEELHRAKYGEGL